MPKYFSSSSGTKLRFLKDRDFENETDCLLAEYEKRQGQACELPIPIDEIVELHLGLSLEFHDMQELFGVSDVHGALWVNEKRVGVDQQLDPSQNPPMIGRYRFTLAHETGHWRLHRHLFQGRANQINLFAEGASRPEYICRSSDKDPLEYQADRFASSLLMPKRMVEQTWHDWRGNMEPMYVTEIRAASQADSSEETILNNAFRPLAQHFQVSAIAMRIRLQSLGFLQPHREASLFDSI